MTDVNLARSVYRASHLYRPEKPFVLRSGIESPEYFDKYLFESDPAMLSRVVSAMLGALPRTSGLPDVWAGLEMGGIPIATALSLRTSVPAVFVRKQSKGHGTDKVIEGCDVKGMWVVIVEDVVTSGGQIVLSVADLRAAGARVDTVLCAIDREQGGREKLQEEGLALHPAFTMSQLKEVTRDASQ